MGDVTQANQKHHFGLICKRHLHTALLAFGIAFPPSKGFDYAKLRTQHLRYKFYLQATPVMSESHNARAPRKSGIPRNFLQTWKSSDASRAKHNGRRPMTACQECRTAKVKCDGRKECRRCVRQGIVCTYAKGKTSNGRSLPIVATTTSGEEHVDWDITGTMSSFPRDDTVHGHTLDGIQDWPIETTQQHFEDFDWGNMGPSIELGFDEIGQNMSSSNLAISMSGLGEQTSNSHALPSQIDLESLRFLLDPSTQGSTHTTPPFLSDQGNQNILASSINMGPSSTSTLSSSSTCRCREDLALLAPCVNDAMQGNQLDEIYKVTSQVMQGCQDIVDCTGCPVGCTDLICMVAVFKQTDCCFEYMAKTDLDGTIMTNFGGLDIPINDPKLRAMLVMNLIHRATEVLDAISTKGQKMMNALCRPSLMARNNIQCLETTIKDFKSILQRVVEQRVAEQRVAELAS